MFFLATSEATTTPVPNPSAPAADASEAVDKVEEVAQGLLSQVQEAMDGIPSPFREIIIGLIILIVGWWLASTVKRVVRGRLLKSRLDNSIVTFATNAVYITLMIAVVMAAVATMGVKTTSFIAILSTAGLAVGLALQGSLSNLASGILIIILRPFKAGHFIEAAGESGVVQEIDFFTTRIVTLDNKLITIPNASLTSGNIINYSIMSTRRVDLTFGVSYSADLDQTREVLMGVLKADSRVLQDPAPQVAVVAMADSSVNFVVRPWVKPDDYWDVYFSVTEQSKKALDKAGISIPFPQRDVHIYNHNAE